MLVPSGNKSPITNRRLFGSAIGNDRSVHLTPKNRSVIQNYFGIPSSAITPLQLPVFEKNRKRTAYAPPVRTSVDKIHTKNLKMQSFIQRAHPVCDRNFQVNSNHRTLAMRTSVLSTNQVDEYGRLKQYSKNPQSPDISEAHTKAECRTLETTIMDFENK